MSQFTAGQLRAIAAEGDVLVEAGAGAGKTRTLVERCLHRVLDTTPQASLDEILMITFTEAAAAEMRHRIGAKLQERLQMESALPADRVADEERQRPLGRVEEQLALLDTARISTLHSFCLQLVREHFHALDLDPQIAVLDEAQAAVLAQETLHGLLEAHYRGASAASLAVQELVETHGQGHDDRIRRLVRRIHSYARSRDDTREWLQRQRAMFESDVPGHWQGWFWEGIAAWKAEWLETLATLPKENEHARKCRETLAAFPNLSGLANASLPASGHPLPGSDEGSGRGEGGRLSGAGPNLSAVANHSQVRGLLDALLAVDDNWPHGTKGRHRPPLKDLFADAKWLRSLLAEDGAPPGTADPLTQDWRWVRGHMLALLGLVEEFEAAFAAAKREQGAVDFADLEQFALRLLWDSGRPTRVAEEWRAKLKLVFVDEYQDINAAQDRILACLGREGAAANRFLVGDVKQSIYRFRLANPRIFQGYARAWRGGAANARVIPLTDNFRSHEAVLEFVNAVFTALMRPEVGGIEYDEEAKLRYGNREGRAAMARTGDKGGARVELLLRLTEGHGGSNSSDAEQEIMDLTDAEREARMVALRLRRLKDDKFQVWDDGKRGFRSVEWKDMAVLLRSPSSRVETFAQEFTRVGVPLEVKRTGFFDALEVADLLGLLTLLDNPQQDIPLLAVLRSPLVGLTVDELATIRLAGKGRFWHALRRFHAAPADLKSHVSNTPAALAAAESAWPKVDRFLRHFAAWRELARQGSLATCLETVLDQTHYEDWQRAQPRGAQQVANVRRLVALARRFDQFQRQGLHHFLRFVADGREAEGRDEIAPAEAGDAVRLMSVHQSKGLEIPVVALAGLGMKFNLGDLSDEIILDEQYGLCPLVRPPGRGASWPSPAHWLAARRQRSETLGEEIRLLYVAMTRAKDKLILAGTATRKLAEGDWAQPSPPRLTVAQLLSASKPMSWLGPLLAGLCGRADWASVSSGQGDLLAWQIVDGEKLALPVTGNGSPAAEPEREAAEVCELAARLNWNYPHQAATELPAKTSVTEVRRRLAEEMDGAAQPLHPAASFARTAIPPPASGLPLPSSDSGRGKGEESLLKLSAAEVGTAHHLLLQHMDLNRAGDAEALRSEAKRLAAAGVLTEEQAAALDFDALAAFWGSATGREIRRQAAFVRRELPFTARFSPEELKLTNPAPADEFVVVQGVADLVVLLPEEIWLVDFKTDDVPEAGLPGRTRDYQPQIQFYSAALERVFGRPVTRRWLHFLAARKTVAA